MGKHKGLVAGLIVVVIAVASCNFGQDTTHDAQSLKPTLGSPIPWATAQPEQVTAHTPAVLANATNTPTMLPSPTPRAPSTATAISAPVVPTKQVLPTLAPTLTRTPFVIVTPAPTLTAPLTRAVLVTPTAAPSLTPAVSPVIAPPPTFTPYMFYTFTPLPTALPSAQVCATCGNLRLREDPGTAGNIVTLLAANTPLTIIGRTADNTWVQVVLAEGLNGWVASEYLDINIDLTVVSVTGAAQDAPTAVAVAASGGVVSGVSSNARRIFLDGLAKGNLPHAFTKVGDSISASPHFLTQIGSGIYQLGDYGHLGAAISFFSGPNGRGFNPFSAASLAAHNGWSTESVLNPANADPNVCKPGETPLQCEYRLVRPAVALIMLGTNDAGGMPAATFRANLQAIVQTSINMGVIPVLSTIPPKHFNPATDGRVAEFNQIIIATARAYDIPLWDYFQAMSRLPNEGLSGDGVHPSIAPSGISTRFDAEHLQYGYTVRNLTALEVLQQILYDADQALPATAAPPGGQPGDVNDPSCQGVRPPRLTVGGQGRVTPGLPNKVRSAPGTGAAQIGTIPGEGVFTVIGGPQCADGYLWWQVNYNGLVGWTANGSADEYWVEPVP